MEETGEPGENHSLTASHWQLFHMLWVGFEPRQWAESVSSQWQCRRPHCHQGWPAVLLYKYPWMTSQKSMPRSLRINATFSCEVIHASTPKRLGGNLACSRVLCPGAHACSAEIECRHCRINYIKGMFLPINFIYNLMYFHCYLFLKAQTWHFQ